MPSSSVTGPGRTAAALIFFLAAAGAPLASAQVASEVTLDASPQVFTVLCAARAAGFLPAAASREPVASEVEAALAGLDPAATAALRDLFESERQRTARDDMNAYLSAALFLSPPPEFAFTVPRDQLPPDVWPLERLPALLRTFYANADLEPLWRRLRPAYEQAITERQGEVARTLLETRVYLRLAGDTSQTHSYTIYLEWLTPPGLTSARSYSDNYYLVVHPQNADFLNAVRHQYLHFLLDPLAAQYAESINAWTPLQAIAQRAPRLPQEFKHDLLLLAAESLVQAVELRLGRLSALEAAARLDESEQNGYLFTRHFFHTLARFEQDKPSIRFYFPQLLRGLDISQEQARLERLQFAPASSQTAKPATAEDLTRTLLLEAESYLSAGNTTAARERFERILHTLDANEPRALYGMAIVASAAGDREQAKRYFLRTLEQPGALHIQGWAHIYLGRIYDLEGDRQQALAHYQAALGLGTRLEKVEAAARRGLERPFGQEGEPDNRAPQF